MTVGNRIRQHNNFHTPVYVSQQSSKKIDVNPVQRKHMYDAYNVGGTITPTCFVKSKSKYLIMVESINFRRRL